MTGPWPLGVLALVVLLLAVLALARRRYTVATVEGASMEPTYRSGDRLLVRRTRLARVRRGDVVVVRRPTERDSSAVSGLLVKRAAAVPGDPVPAVVRLPEAVVPPGRLLVLSDNPHNTLDSRAFGYVPADRVVGVVVRPFAPAG